MHISLSPYYKINVAELYIVYFYTHMKLIIIGITILTIFVLIGLWWAMVHHKSISKTHSTVQENFEDGGAILEGIVQCKNGFSIKYNNPRSVGNFG